MRRKTSQRKVCAALGAAALLCLVVPPVSAANPDDSRPVLIRSAPASPAPARKSSAKRAHNSVHPGTPMVLEPVSSALSFDLGGSETQKLQLQLAHPLMLDTGTQVLSNGSGSNMLGLDATLRMPVANGFSLQGGIDQVAANNQFQTLGSIHCLNGTLKPDSYTASGCRFISDSGSTFDRRTLSLGASHQAGNFTSSVNWFTSEIETGSPGVYKLNQFNATPLLDNPLLSPVAPGGMLPGALTSDYLNSEATGIDLNFQVGFTTGQEGEIRLGLALARVLEANYQGIYGPSLSPLDWNLAQPFNSAALGLEWSSGAFSSGIRGYYREPVSFLNQQGLDSSSTFDVHFTWRTPWNANLSVGASNVLGAGVDNSNGNDKTADRFESIYGRIPYVRYQQDL